MWVIDFHTCMSSFSNVCGYKCSQLSSFVAFLKHATSEPFSHSYSLRFHRIPVTSRRKRSKMFADTQTNPDLHRYIMEAKTRKCSTSLNILYLWS